jgi:hypothetical protein
MTARQCVFDGFECHAVTDENVCGGCVTALSSIAEGGEPGCAYSGGVVRSRAYNTICVVSFATCMRLSAATFMSDCVFMCVRLLCDSNELVVADTCNNRLCLFKLTGEFVSTLTSSIADLSDPCFRCAVEAKCVISSQGPCLSERV